MARALVPAVHVAFLRGINVGGNNVIPMADLRRLFEEHGARDVSTYIQSGNVIFSAPAKDAASIATTVSDAIEERLGFRSVIVVRTAEALDEVASQNPFAVEGAADRLYVGLMSALPSASSVASLEPDRSPGDAFEVRGAHVYLRFQKGVAKSRITNAWLDARLSVTVTIRNWKTITELARRVRQPT